MFSNHGLAAVTLNGVETFYDPSYGKTYSSLADMEQQAIDGYSTGIIVHGPPLWQRELLHFRKKISGSVGIKVADRWTYDNN